jgi:O-antigen/teichoic acid export membrane protein
MSADDGAERAQARGGSLLLAGRVLAVGLNFVTQVLLVRALTKDDYGAFAYALSIANLGETLVTLGLDRGTTRFVPIYEERGERERVAGTLALVFGGVLVLSVVLVVVVVLSGEAILSGVDDDGRALLVILVLLAPIQALDNLFVGLFAVFGRAGSIFVRRFVLGPVLRLAVVLALVVTDGSPTFLAVGYVVAGGVGVVLYSGVVLRLLRRRGILGDLRHRRFEVPWRPVLAFTLPLLSSDAVFVLVDSVGAIVLGQVGGAADVASLRAVLPVARLNQLALASFGVLFTPLAARRFARDDLDGVSTLYWQTAAFVALVTFPVFAVTCCLARPVTVALFGSRYEGSATVLAALALGYYVSSALGFNGLTLNVFGRVRAVLVVNLLAAATSIALTAALVPPYGAAGAGIAAGGTLVAHNVLRQVAMGRTTPVPPLDAGVVSLYATIVVASTALAVVQLVVDPPLAVGLVGVAAATVPVLLVARRRLDLVELFPEVQRVPILRRLLAPAAAG